MDRDAAYARITALPGLGPWSATCVMGPAWGDRDCVPLGDYNLPHLVSWTLAGERRSDDTRMLELLEPFAGHRARVIRLLTLGGSHPPRRGHRRALRDIQDR